MGKCIFSGREANIVQLAGYDGFSINVTEFGEYWITGIAWTTYSQPNALSLIERLQCLREVVLLNREGLIPFWTTGEHDPLNGNESRIVQRVVSEVKDRPIEHKEKGKRLMLCIAEKSRGTANPFSFVRLSDADRCALSIFSDDDLYEWLIHLRSRGAIQFPADVEGFVKRQPPSPSFKDSFLQQVKNANSVGLTIAGWEEVEASSLPANSRNVFIAMAFTNQNRDPIPNDTREAIKATLRALDWNPIVVDEVQHNDGIMDKVVASINESRFVIAELTYQKTGVYYEAGYAKGRGLPVIHVVRRADLNNCHFDVRHLSLIVWDEVSDLTEKLKDRIRATIESRSATMS